jgi:IS30 family transposase
MKKKYNHLNSEERFCVEILKTAGMAIRRIAEFLGRSPNTISREIAKNVVNGVYDAKKANHKAYFKRWRSKRQCLKVALDRFLTRCVEQKLRKKWSPKQISGYLRREYGISCSAKAIYKFAVSRGLEHLLFWGWNNHKGGRKRYTYNTEKDGRKYIEERLVPCGLGHFEMDFIVSRQSTWSFLVVVDRVTKDTLISRIPNRKHTTVSGALRELLSGVTVKSITTDNDIAFGHWKELETLLNTQIYFTHPYHSWEKGLVENTNRWIRCFVPKRRDIGTVSEEEMQEILSFLNDRPRECIGFRTAREYTRELTDSVLLRG